MIVINYVLLSLLEIHLILIDIRLLVEQYYSPIRFLKIKAEQYYSRVKSFGFVIFFIILGIVAYYYNYRNISVLINVLTYYLFSPKLKLKKYPITRRSGWLIAIIIAICQTLSAVLYIYGNQYLVSLLFPIITIFSIFIGFFLLYPSELLIRNYYLKKARIKILRNKYIVIGITGSFGKTTFKNIIYSILKQKYRISAQNHNYNTLMGLCKYINNEIKDSDEILIVELGIDQVGGMDKFKKLLSLDYAFISAIGEMHLATFKSIDNIAREKCKIERLIKEDGLLFVNEAIPSTLLSTLKSKYFLFSEKNITCREDFFYQIFYHNAWINTNLTNIFQIAYVDGAIKIAEALKLKKWMIVKGLNDIHLPSRRARVIKKDNLVFFDDSYNANYYQMVSVIEKISRLKCKKIIITGGLIELGDRYDELNFDIGQKLAPFDQVFLITKIVNHPLARGYNSIKSHGLVALNTIDEAIQRVAKEKVETIVFIAAKGNDDYLK